MSKIKLNSISLNWLGNLSVLAFLLLFLNFSVVFHYINLNDLGLTTLELCEDEESEEKEGKEEVDEVEYELQTIISRVNTGELMNNNVDRNASILIAYHIDVFTPPPELS